MVSWFQFKLMVLFGFWLASIVFSGLVLERLWGIDEEDWWQT